MAEIDLDVGPLLEPERAGSLVCTDAEQRLVRDDVTSTALPACDALELPQLLERVDADVRVGADADADASRRHPLDGEEAVAEVRLGGRAHADSRSGLGEQVELPAIGVGRVHDGGPLAQAARPLQQLDRADAVLRETLFDLARLL